MKNRFHFLHLLPLTLAAVLSALLAPHLPPWGSWLLAGISLICALWAAMALQKKEPQDEATKNKTIFPVYRRREDIFRRVADNLGVPMALFDDKGKTLWSNPAYENLLADRQLSEVLREFNPRYPKNLSEVRLGNQVVDLYALPVYDKEGETVRKQCFVYLTEKTEAVESRQKYQSALSTMAYIQIDNYDELEETSSDAVRAAEQALTEYIRAAGGVCRRYEQGKYLVVLERGRLVELEKRKFNLLETVREIKAAGALPVTVSMGVGIAPALAESNRCAQQAMELALGRGGDQVVVREGDRYTFYGGKGQGGERYSRVKTRVFARALSNLMSQSGQIFVMGHKRADFDCMGAAMGIVRCASAVGRKVNIVLEGPNETIEPFLKELRERSEYQGLILSPEAAREQCRADSLIVVVDTQRPDSTPAPELLYKTGNLVLIDHHRRGVESFQTATLQYTEPAASSCCELMAETLQYFTPEVRPTPFECSILLSGMMIDTKSFAVGAGARTFEAAGYLRRCGADPNFVRQLRQDDIDTYNNRASVVREARFIAPGVALAVCPGDLSNPGLLAAQAADTLTTIRGVEAAFVLGELPTGITVSGRSIGNINVQLILETLGGGGQLNVAGALLKDVSMVEARRLVIEAVHNYLSSADQ